MKRYVPKEGFVQLWRRVRDHRFWPTYKQRRFTDFEAWVDLLFDATYKTHRRVFRGHTFDLKPGELVFSQNDRAERWRWSRSKVRTFLNDLYLNGEASHKEVDGITRVTIHKLAGYAKPVPETSQEIFYPSKKGGEGKGKSTSKTLSSSKVQELIRGVLDKLDNKKKG